ncbi:hypothetical protein [Halorubrum tropicale]|uniref:Uncharacterized protein n=1 Tax=Halorubrum tropicale TaxID=1765655 RepID=A0A0N0BP06_9EURY|nr:hypothetical protein [Halorubrum tropicale]KOX93266.1 hypothetical protein AMR74_16635 [Halorubrum tropicale]
MPEWDTVDPPTVADGSVVAVTSCFATEISSGDPEPLVEIDVSLDPISSVTVSDDPSATVVEDDAPDEVERSTDADCDPGLSVHANSGLVAPDRLFSEPDPPEDDSNARP